MLNVSPIGRNCSQQEREDFEQYDKVHHVAFTNDPILEKHVCEHEVLHNFQYSVGAKSRSMYFLSDGTRRTVCQFLQADGYDDIHFFGDKTELGGNDYEIYTSPLCPWSFRERTGGHNEATGSVDGRNRQEPHINFMVRSALCQRRRACCVDTTG